MRTNPRPRALAAFALSALAATFVPAAAQAASAMSTDGSGAPVEQIFRVTVPGLLYFRVGAAASVSTLTFALTTANAGDGAAVAATGGDVSGGADVTVQLRCNLGAVTITPTNNTAGLGLGNGVDADRIPFTQITTDSSDPAALPAPALTNAGGSPTNPPITAGSRVTRVQGTWTYSYANSTLVSAGTYTGTVTYTAAVL